MHQFNLKMLNMMLFIEIAEVTESLSVFCYHKVIFIDEEPERK
jgi:hypothetical protein